LVNPCARPRLLAPDRSGDGGPLWPRLKAPGNCDLRTSRNPRLQPDSLQTLTEPDSPPSQTTAPQTMSRWPERRSSGCSLRILPLAQVCLLPENWSSILARAPLLNSNPRLKQALSNVPPCLRSSIISYARPRTRLSAIRGRASSLISLNFCLLYQNEKALVAGALGVTGRTLVNYLVSLGDWEGTLLPRGRRCTAT